MTLCDHHCYETLSFLYHVDPHYWSCYSAVFLPQWSKTIVSAVFFTYNLLSTHLSNALVYSDLPSYWDSLVLSCEWPASVEPVNVAALRRLLPHSTTLHCLITTVHRMAAEISNTTAIDYAIFPDTHQLTSRTPAASFDRKYHEGRVCTVSLSITLLQEDILAVSVSYVHHCGKHMFLLSMIMQS